MSARAADPRYARATHLLRAGAAALVAGVLVLVALGREDERPVEAPAAARVGILNAPVPAAIAPAVPIEAASPAPALASEAVVEAAVVAVAQEAGEPGAALVPAALAEVPEISARAPLARAPAPPPGPGYMVQLGVFAAPENAERLRDKLTAQDYPAHLQSRVVVGPYPDLKSAEAASARLRGAHRLDGVIVPPRKP